MIARTYTCDGCRSSVREQESEAAIPYALAGAGWVCIRMADGGPPSIHTGEFCLDCTRVMFRALREHLRERNLPGE